MSATLHFSCPSCARINRVSAERARPTCGACKEALDTTGKPVHLDDAALAKLVASVPVPVVVDFYADWCGPCRMLAPVLEELGTKHAGKLIVVKIDTEKHQQTAQKLGVQGIPALFAYKGGKVVADTAGFQPLAGIESWVGPYL